MNLRDALAELGATDAQLNSKVFAMAEQAVADGSVDGLSDARKSVDALTSRIDASERRFRSTCDSAQSKANVLSGLIKQAQEVIEPLGDNLDTVKVSDQNLRDAVNAYTLILSRTKQVLGDDAMTEAVIIQLLETASYGLWRSIMGPKDQPKQTKTSGMYYR